MNLLVCFSSILQVLNGVISRHMFELMLFDMATFKGLHTVAALVSQKIRPSGKRSKWP